MPSTTYKGLEVQVTGSNSGTWGDVLNDSMISYVDLMLGGITNVSLAAVNVTLTAAQARNAIVRFTGVLLANVIVTTPCQGFTYFDNATTGSFTVEIEYTAGAGASVIIEQGVTTEVVIDATNGVRIANAFPDLMALNALTGTGIPKRTGTNTWAMGAGVTDLAATTANRLYGTDGAGASAVIAPTAPLAVASSALALPAGSIIQSVYAQLATVFTTAAQIPVDNTVPQNTEGAELLTASITPRLINSRMRVRFHMMAAISTNQDGMIVAALFQDSVASALSATVYMNAQLGDPNEVNKVKQIVLEVEISPATLSAITFKIRVGGPTAATGSTGTVTVNGANSSQLFGGVSQATLIIEEILVY
jgi:hypothetical protein